MSTKNLTLEQKQQMVPKIPIMSFDEVLDVYNFHKKPKVQIIDKGDMLKEKMAMIMKPTVVKKVVEQENIAPPHHKKYLDLKTDFKRLTKDANKSRLEIYDIYKLNGNRSTSMEDMVNKKYNSQ